MSIKRQKPEADTLTVLRDHTFVTIRKTHNSKSSPELPLTNFLRSPWAISHRQATKLRTVWEKHHPGGTRRAGWPPGAEILGGEGPHPRVAAAGAPPAPPENPWPPPPLAAVPQHGEHLPPSSLSPAARCPERCPHPAMAVRGGSTHCTAPSASGAGAVRGQRESERASEVRPSVRPPVLPTCLPSCRPLLPGRLASSCSASSFSRVPLPGYEHPSGGGVEAAASHRPVHARPAKDAPPGGRPPPPVASVSPAAALSRQSRPYVAHVTGGRGAGRKGRGVRLAARLSVEQRCVVLITRHRPREVPRGTRISLTWPAGFRAESPLASCGLEKPTPWWCSSCLPWRLSRVLSSGL